MKRAELTRLLDSWLQPARFRDVAENGLQVEGKHEVQRIVCGVSANQALIDEAVARGADAIFVHHGLVWGGGIRRLEGFMASRVRTLLLEGISLYAYHLPLDAHPTLGNNAGLADALGLAGERQPFGEYKGQLIGVRGELAAPCTLAMLVERMRERVGPPLVCFGDPERHIARVGVCSGGAPDLLHEACREGLDLYVTGEVTEWVQAVAAESGVAFIAGGHHATERFGAQRVAAALAAEGLEATFVDVANPA